MSRSHLTVSASGSMVSRGKFAASIAAQVGTEGDLFTALELLKTEQATINQNRQVQEFDGSGLTKNKLDLRSELIRLNLLFAAGLKAHATSTKNSELKTKADYKEYELQKSADFVLADIGQQGSYFLTGI